MSPQISRRIRAAIGGFLLFLGAAVIGYAGLRDVAVRRLTISQRERKTKDVSSDAAAWEWLLGGGSLAGGIALLRGRRRDSQ